MEMINKMKEIQKHFLKYIDTEYDVEENYQNFITIFDDQQIIDKSLCLVLHFISNISYYHFHENNFYAKIEKVLLFFKSSIKNNFINSSIFNLFKFNKRILLFLIKNEILTIDLYIAQQMMKKKFKEMRYPQFFFY